jgi:hypothetical protein
MTAYEYIIDLLYCVEEEDDVLNDHNNDGNDDIIIGMINSITIHTPTQ